MSIKRGVNFYSYQLTYYKGEYDLEGLISEASKTGAEGIELIMEQMPVGSYPNPSDVDVDNWFFMMEKYKTKPVSMVSFIDWMLYKGRILTLREQVDLMAQDLRLAAQLGFKVLRVLCPVRKEVMEASIPYAEKYDVKMGLEVHSPMMLHARWTDEYYEMFDRSGSKHVGLIPDFGIFQTRPAKKRIDDALKQGANPKTMDFLVKSCIVGIDIKKTIQEMNKMGAGPAEMAVAMSMIRSRYNDPEQLRGLKQYIIHIHGKFNEMDEDYNETSIDYENPIRILKEIGYDGYICSEYEGQQMFGAGEEPDEIEQVRRHQEMLKRMI
jgi:sugar phosphate isomerase/epimerase